MFKAGDYTVQEVAEKWDCSEEGVLEAFKDNGNIRRRQYWIFGPMLFKREIVDDMAPDVRAMMKRLGTTRADTAQRKQDLAALKAKNEQSEKRLEETRQHLREQSEDFSRQMMEMMRAHVASLSDDEEPPATI